MNSKIKLISNIVVLVAVFFIGMSFGGDDVNVSLSDDVPSTINGINILIDPGDGDIVSFNKVDVQDDTSLGDILVSMQESKELEINYKDYGGDLGLFIEKIDGVGGDDSGRWWQYWVNNIYSLVGVSAYDVKKGDVIMFKYTSQQSEIR